MILMFITMVVDAHECQIVDIFDIQREYLHTKTYEDVIMLMEVPLSDLMMTLEPKIYRKYVIIISKVKSLLYV